MDPNSPNAALQDATSTIRAPLQVRVQVDHETRAVTLSFGADYAVQLSLADARELALLLRQAANLIDRTARKKGGRG